MRLFVKDYSSPGPWNRFSLIFKTVSGERAAIKSAFREDRYWMKSGEVMS